jgi:hypothetical protein
VKILTARGRNLSIYEIFSYDNALLGSAGVEPETIFLCVFDFGAWRGGWIAAVRSYVRAEDKANRSLRAILCA